MALCKTVPEVIHTARQAGLESVANRLDYLYKLDIDNGDAPINSDTINMLVSFLIDHPEFATDVITANPDGFVHLRFNIKQNNILNVQFLPSNKVWFVHMLKETDFEHFKIRKNSTTSLTNMLEYIMPFM